MGNLISKVYQAGADLAAKAGTKIVAALTGVDASQLVDLLDTTNTQPSLAYVPIYSESMNMRRTVDVGSTMLISQSNQEKTYITDNAAPRPRTWTVQGYIKSAAPLVESYLVSKPTLQVQQSILEAASDSRQTVPLKTDTGEVVEVLIQDLQIGSTPKGNNVRSVTVTVQEVVTLTNAFDALGNELDNAGASSIPLRAVINLGKNSALGGGMVGSTSLLLKSINF